jgi:hypothetical protein
MRTIRSSRLSGTNREDYVAADIAALKPSSLAALPPSARRVSGGEAPAQSGCVLDVNVLKRLTRTPPHRWFWLGLPCA